MKIAYIGSTTSKSINERGLCYLKYLPRNTHHVFFQHDFHNLDPAYEFTMSLTKQMENEGYIFETKTDGSLPYLDGYDHLINLSDKYFQLRRNFYMPIAPNLVDKKVLAQHVPNFDIRTPSINIETCSDLFIKPRISSGAYTSDEFGYTKITRTDLLKISKHPKFNEYIVQQYLPSNECVLFILMCNGTNISVVDSCYNVFAQDSDGRPLCVFGDFTHARHAKNLKLYEKTIQKLLTMLYELRYNKICGTFNVQFSLVDGELYLHDFNTRTGPFSVGIEKNNFFNTGYYDQIQWCFGLGASLKTKNCSWIHYAEKDGVPLVDLSLLYSDPHKNITLNENKKSGMVREDYDVKIKLF